MTLAGNSIVVDWRTGAISNASSVERVGLTAMSIAARALAPLNSRGISYVAKLVSKALPSQKDICLVLDEDLEFAFPYGDAYWSRLLKPLSLYEEEIEALLLTFSDLDYAFIDCGANYGYWSAKVTSRRFGNRQTAAVELDPVNFERLCENAVLNDNRFICINRAVFDKDGEVLNFFGRKHEARSLVDQQVSGHVLGDVETITLDKILEEAGLEDHSTIVLKLDVEGSEIEALKGASNLLQKDVLIIYEDHGADRSHSVSKYLSEECGMRLFGYNADRFFELGAVLELDGLKRDRRKGYDFFATQSRFWMDRLAGLVAGQAQTGDGSVAIAQ